MPVKPARISATDEDILTVLLGRELCGSEILTDLNLDRPEEWLFMAIYPALNRLLDKGFLSKRVANERGYYSVTGAGARALKQTQDYRAALTQLREDCLN